MIAALVAFVAVSTGTVQIHLTDGHNKPIPDHQVWLEETNSTKAIRPFGYQWWVPTEKPFYTGTTDAHGDVRISGVLKGKPMMVITRFGPRFDPILKREDRGSSSMDVMKFDGAVYAGKTAHVYLADDWKVSGTVMNRETGAPIAGATVILHDTFTGHMGGYPLTPLEEAKTDAKVHYLFKNLPPCAYTVTIDKIGAEMGAESKVLGDPWFVMGYRDKKGEFGSFTIHGFQATEAESRVDFRVYRISKLTVTVRKGSLKSLSGWWERVVSLDEEDFGGYGRKLDYDFEQSPSIVPKATQDIESVLLAGKYIVVFENEKSGAVFRSRPVVLRYGENKALDFDLSEIAKKGKKG